MEDRKILIDRSMRGLDEDNGRIYEDVSPSLLSRLYKEPHLIMYVRKVDKMKEVNTMPKSRAEQSRAEQSRAEQSRAEQSRAEQHEECRIGNLYGYDGGNYAGQVYDPTGISPTLTNMQGGGRQPHTVEVKKMEIKIRQATTQGYIECEVPGLIDADYPSSQTRRGRVIRGGQISPTLTTASIPSLIEIGDRDFHNFIYEIDGETYLIRIRKLTPRECWRLMSFSDEDFDKAEAVNSNTQLYKQAGNSIVKNCLVAIFGQMFEGKEEVYKRWQREKPDM